MNINRKHKIRKPSGPQEENYFFSFRFSDITLRKCLNKNCSTIKHSERKKKYSSTFFYLKDKYHAILQLKKPTMDEGKDNVQLW